MTAGRFINTTRTRFNPARGVGVSPLVNLPSEARDLSARAVIRGGHSCNLPLASTRYVRVAKLASHRGSFTRTRRNVGLREEELNSAEEADFYPDPGSEEAYEAEEEAELEGDPGASRDLTRRGFAPVDAPVRNAVTRNAVTRV